MRNTRRRAVALVGSVLSGAVTFGVARWAPALALSMAHAPPPPITVSRVFPILDSSVAHENANPPSVMLRAAKKGSDDSIQFFLSSDFDTFPTSPVYSATTVIGSMGALATIAGFAGPDEVNRFAKSVGQEVSLRYNPPFVQIQIPTEMRVTRDGFVTAELNSPTITPEMNTPPQLVVAKSVFDVAGPSRPTDSSWKWDVVARTIGDRRTLTLEFPSSTKFDFRFDVQPTDRLTVKGNTVTAAVDVRDELGLTQSERTLLTAFGAIIGVLGTLLGYPFIKGRLEPRPAPAPTGPPRQIVRPQTKGRKR